MNGRFVSDRVSDVVSQIIYQHSDGKLPISPLKIAKNMGISVIDRKYATELLDLLGISNTLKSGAAYTIKTHEHNTIIIDYDHTTPERRRLQIAHEIGHIILDNKYHFFCDNCAARIHRSPEDMLCDMFALFLLVPPVLWKQLNRLHKDQIDKAFGISPMVAYLLGEHFKHFPSHTMTENELKMILKFKPHIEELKRSSLQHYRIRKKRFASDFASEFFYL